jgi:serine/threonine-protein kinase TNNI3K
MELPRARDKDGSTLLHLAVREGNWEGNVDIARLIVEYGADAVVQDRHGSTPLHIAAQNVSADLARLLAEHGADTTAQDKDGSTPLS